MTTTTAIACPGVCNTTWRRTHEGDPTWGQPTWCPPDAARIRRLLAELDDLAALTAASSDGYREPPTQPASATHAPTPSPAADDLDELAAMLRGWEDAYRELRDWPSPPRRGYLATVTTTTIAWLTAHLDGILTAPIAADFGAEVERWHRELVGKTRSGTGRRRGLAACPRCGLRLLSWEDGDDHVICGSCNRHMSMDEYREHTAAEAARHAQAIA